MKILYTSKGAEILVDARDYKRLCFYSWHLIDGYACRWIRTKRKRTLVIMHRDIMGFSQGDGRIVDHMNGNKLDNRRRNLRECTNSQNTWNRGVNKNNSSGFTGVSFKKKSGTFSACITHAGKATYLGTYKTAEEAYEMYSLAACLLRPEFARQAKNV